MPRFEAIIDQEKPIRLLSRIIRKGKIPHALLFTGIEGIGKEEAANIFAMACNCLATAFPSGSGLPGRAGEGIAGIGQRQSRLAAHPLHQSHPFRAVHLGLRGRLERFGSERTLQRAQAHACARSEERRSRISPRIASRSSRRRLERLRRDRHWNASYGEAMRCWVAGDRHVVFPAGTYRMRVVHSVACAPPPD